MEYLVTAKQMQQYDRTTSEHFGIPSVVLMERAAMACVEILQTRQAALEERLGFPAGKKVLIVAGSGNNGGDGFAIGRLLMQEGFLVDFWLVGEKQKLGVLPMQQLESVEAYGGVVMRNPAQKEYDIIVDALFGIGLTREVEGIYREAITYMNEQDAFVLAVDIPSGIHADTGQVMGAAVCADVTVTFGFLKLGTFLYPGSRYAGQVVRRRIGITEDSFLEEPAQRFTLTEPVTEWMPPRNPDGNKGSFGKVLLAAGSDGMAGAAMLSGRAVFASGAGMVKIITPESNRVILQEALPEAMTACFCSGAEIETLCRQSESWADVIAAGPGMSQSEEAGRILHFFIENSQKPLVLDADAINLLAQDAFLLEKLMGLQKNEETRRLLVLTPHPGELARLEGCRVAEITENPEKYTKKWAQLLQAAVLCKNARTIVSAPDGSTFYNSSGNSGMATAGSGDVLTGMIAALLAQYTGQKRGCAKQQADHLGQSRAADSFLPACIGVYLHGLAGDRAAHQLSEYSMKAGDIIEMTGALLSGRSDEKEGIK